MALANKSTKFTEEELKILSSIADVLITFRMEGACGLSVLDHQSTRIRELCTDIVIRLGRRIA